MTNRFPERLKDLREDKGFLQAELANILKVSKSAVSGWEVGRNEPSYEMLMQIAAVFKVSVDYLLGYENNIYI